MSGHGHSHDNMVPPAAIAFAGALILASFTLVLSVRSNILPAAPTQAELRQEKGVKPVRERMLHFADTADGFVLVTDARSGAEVARIGQEGSGFIRGVMRGLARERRMHQLGAKVPFKLTLYQDTSLTLVDPTTGRTLELNGFGHTNRAAFLKLIAPEAKIPERPF
jgi:putative photosynthetic complex assembly protein